MIQIHKVPDQDNGRSHVRVEAQHDAQDVALSADIVPVPLNGCMKPSADKETMHD